MHQRLFQFFSRLVGIQHQVHNAVLVGAVDGAGGAGRDAYVGESVARRIALGFDHVEGDAGDTAVGGIQHAADDFVCIRFADGSTRSGVTSHPARLVVRRRIA